MGTQVQGKSYFPGYFSMKNLNEDSNSSSWPLFYGERTLTNGQYYNGYTPRTFADAYPGYDKDQLKQKMLEHEAVFRNQVYELHRVYRIQRDMMEEIKRTELNKRQMSIEPSSSSSFLGSQKPSEDAGKWHASGFLLANSGNPKASVSGAEIVNSPLSCTKGNTMPTDRANGCISKDCEVLETRPSKVRKKLFDLQLPADEYIDTEEGEQLQDCKIIERPSPFPNGNLKVTPEKFGKFFLNCEKVTSQMNASASDSYLGSRMRLADLNEPVQVDDQPSVDFLGYSANHGESKGINKSSGSYSAIIGSGKEETLKAFPLDQSRSSGVISVANKNSERDWLSGIHESGEGLHSLSGQRKNNLIPLPHGFQQDKLPIPPQPAETSVNKSHQPLGIFPTDYGRKETWRRRTDCGLENMDRDFSNSNVEHLESGLSSQVPSLYSYGNSAEVPNSWSHSALSWGKPTSSSFSQKLSSFQAYPALHSSSLLGKSSNSSAQSHGILGDKLADKENLRSKRGMTTDLPTMNVFYNGSSSASKEIMGRYPSVGLNNLNYKESFNMASNHYSNHGAGDIPRSCVKPAKDMDLNVVQSKCPSDEVVALHDVEVINEKPNAENHFKVLPWLRPESSCKSEAVNVRELNSGLFLASKSFWLGEPVKDLNNAFLGVGEVGLKKENGETHGVKKILGVSISEKPTIDQPCTLPVEKAAAEVKNKLIDINLACDEQIDSKVLAVEKATDTKVTHVRNYIDLNSCLSEDEESLIPSVASNNSVVKRVVEIDLEAPAPETEDDLLAVDGDKLHEASIKSAESPVVEQTNEEVVRAAAEAIVFLSKSDNRIHIKENTCEPPEDPLKECILWFANVTSSADKRETNGGKEIRCLDSLLVGNCSSDEIDEFEVMTLQLQETKEEDYMPKPFVLEVPKVDEAGADAAPNRSRKGQTRRGRQRRDFQRDILPGLASLSRHEVTEDLQTFGGLMRATGQSWDAGLNRRNGTRNGRARGRRRTVVVDAVETTVPTPACTPLIQQLNNIEASLEDRSLTGWGKTTRRPRRQRCPAGNPPPAAVLT